jgi:hypothetical protein
MRSALVSAAFAAALLTAVPASAEMLMFKADLKASTEVPKNDSKATGVVDANYDTVAKKLSWTITSTGLTGAATGAHFHGPAEVGKNAAPVVPISGSLASPMKGEATLTDAQAADLQAGKWYFNVHTAAHKDGEIRGQMMKR